MFSTKAYAAASATAPLAPSTVPRRDPGPRDVRIDVLFCGVCHSDVHTVRDEWKAAMPTVYPVVPGHEIVGRVAAVGKDVRSHRPGDLVAVGCLVASDGTCPQCAAHRENFCANATFTYNAPDLHGTAPVTYGGYSAEMVVDERFVLRVPKNLDPAGAAPLLCAGITTYSPMRRHGVGPGKKVGVVGLGGLGHMGVKFSRAFGAHTTVFTTTAAKAEDARRLGADDVVLSRDADAMTARAGTFDFLLDTVSADHDLDAFLNLLATDGVMALVGAPEKPLKVSAFSLIFGRRSLVGSLIGGLAETQEMLDFCGKHGVVADVETIPIRRINEAYDRLLKSDVKYRFCIDMASLRAE